MTKKFFHGFLKNTKFNFVFWEFAAKLTRNKALEFNTYWTKTALTDPFLVEVRYNRRSDHAGLHIWLCLYRFELQFDIYDHRHWDHEKNQWEACECDSEGE